MGKRLFDLVLAAILVVVLSPLLLLTAIVIAVTMGWPIFYCQRRAGLHGKPFLIHKFRTMTNARGTDGQLLPDPERLTPVGRIIRSTSMDELPQLVNVVKGEMSLVGPRPLPVEYSERYSAHQARRSLVKPGVTGWTAVNGRSALDWEVKFDLDVWYVDHHSLWLDLRILWRTFVMVVRREGISYPGEVNSPTWTGSQPQ